MERRGEMPQPGRRKFTPRNPEKLTDEELDEYLALSDEEEHIGRSVHSDISVKSIDEDIYRCAAYLVPKIAPPQVLLPQLPPHTPLLPELHHHSRLLQELFQGGYHLKV